MIILQDKNVFLPCVKCASVILSPVVNNNELLFQFNCGRLLSILEGRTDTMDIHYRPLLDFTKLRQTTLPPHTTSTSN